MKILIVANWKCNPTTLKEAKQLFNSVKKGVKDVKGVNVVICPPLVYLSELGIRNKELRIKMGAQDVFWEEKGAFTGEISPTMLKNLGCEYVIIGHSERRKYFRETDEMINKKIKAVLTVKLKPILCIGETERERKEGKAFEVLKNQLKKSLDHLATQSLSHLIIAYEPVWAIGTGNPCGISEAREINLFIKKLLKNCLLLYGGSVNSKNATDYIREANFDGLLVGGTSLNPKEFVKLVKNVSEIKS